MAGLRSLFSVALLVLLAAPAATAADADPAAVPRIGTIAPAFGLYAFEKQRGDDIREAVQLEDHCGLRPGDVTGVLVFFVDHDNMADMELANEWFKRFQRQGFRIIGISLVEQPLNWADDIIKANYKYPVLDDRHGVVAKRFGVDRAPFSFLLNEECRVLGFSNNKLTEDGEGLPAAIEAQVSGQLTGGAPRFDE
jgi:hypothetical protein